MRKQKHVFYIYPPQGCPKLSILHRARKRREREFPGVDIDAIHYKLGAVKKRKAA